MTSIREAINTLDSALNFLLDHYAVDPQATHFNAEDIKAFEDLTQYIPLISAGMTKTAVLANAATLVGSTHIIDYLTKGLGLSQSEAWLRVKRAEEFFGDVLPTREPDPRVEPDPGTGQPPETKQQRETREKREAEEKTRAAEARRQRREQARQEKLTAEKMDIISQELGYLNEGTTPSRDELYTLAMAETKTRNPEDLRKWVRAAVEKTNHTFQDPFAATRSRYVYVGKQDANGGSKISMYLDGEATALLIAALSGTSKKGHGLNLADPSTDKRTYPQRKADGFVQILKDYNSGKLSRRGGVGTIVVSMSAKDIADLPEAKPDKRFPTNTGINLTASEILRLGAAKYDFGCVLDSESGRPLHLGRTARSATLSQRLALLASELVCSGKDCGEPAANCDIHHIEPWYAGGVTDIENLTQLCYKDHPRNDDTRTGQGNKGYADHDPVSGRVGQRQPCGELIHNESTAQQESGGAKIRAQEWPDPVWEEGSLEEPPPGCPF